MAFSFFTDPTQLGPEPQYASYGAKTETKYQVSSGFKSRGPNVNPGAYAIADGRIAVCWGYGSSEYFFDKRIVNVILKPDTQPGGNIPFVKYYIYKGILATSFFDIDNNNHKVVMNSTTNDQRAVIKPINNNSLPFLIRMNDARNAMIATPTPGIPTPEILNEDNLGFGRTNGEKSTSTALIDTIDRIFNNNWDDDPTALGNIPVLPVVFEGEKIGDFISSLIDVGPHGRVGEFSLEIILDRVGYNSNFSIAAGNESGSNSTINGRFSSNHHIITLEPGNGSSGEINTTEGTYNRSLREQVLNYMDPCTFYGAFGNHGMPTLNIPSDSGSANSISSGDPDQIRINSIYQNILNSPGYDSNGNILVGSNIFSNRNTVYVDIRDRYNNTFDWVRDKSISYKRENLKIGFNGNTNNERGIDYHGEDGSAQKKFSISKKWPILAIEVDETVDANSNPQPGEFIHGYPFNQPNPNPTLPNNPNGFASINLGFKRPNNGFESVSLYLENYQNIAPRFAQNASPEGFFRIADNSLEWASPIEILTPNFNGDSNNFSVPLSNYIRIIHIQHYTDFYEGSDPCNFDINSDEINNPYYHPINDEDQYGNDQDNDYPQPLERHPENYTEFLWPVDTRLNWSGWQENKIRSTIYSDKVYLDNFPNGSKDFMANIGIARDADSDDPNIIPKVTLFAYNTIPSDSGIGLIDREFNEPATPYQFSDNNSYLQNVGRNILDYGFERVSVNSTAGTINIDHLFRLTNEQIQLELTGPSPGIINVSDLAFFTINKSDFDSILNQWEIEKNEISVDPIKSWWSFEPIESGQLPGGRSGEFIRYQIQIKYLNRSNGTAPCRLETFIPSDSFNQPFTTAKIKEPTQIDQIAANVNTVGRGFSIEDQGGVDVINCTIYLIQGSSISYNEFLSYKNYAEKNIKQVWSNIEGQPNVPLVPLGVPNNPSAYTNLGLTARVNSQSGNIPNTRTDAITAWNIVIVQGGPQNLRDLLPNEVAFIIERSIFADTNDPDLMRRDRSFVSPQKADIISGGSIVGHRSNPRIGKFVFNGQVGIFNDCTNPYLDDNTAAHEFGHILGLTDRYTYSVNVDPLNNVIRTTGGPRNVYLPDSFDIDYTEDYRWICNLMAVDANKIPNQNIGSAGALPNTKFSALHNDFWNLTSPYASDSNAAYSNLAHGNTFITPKQWQIIKAFANDDQQFESNEFFNPEFKLQPYVFFTAQGTVWPYGSFAGYDPNPVPSGRAVSDFGFQDTSTNGVHRMSQRIAAIGASDPSPIIGYFWPFDPLNSHPLVNGDAVSDNRLMFNIRIGNEVKILFPSMNGGVDASGVPFPIQLNHPNNFDLVSVSPLAFTNVSPLHNTFNLIGSSDPANMGRTIWNKITDRGFGTSYSEQYRYPSGTMGDLLMHNFSLRTTYDNRDEIIELLVYGAV
jgi:hypothetical protein